MVASRDFCSPLDTIQKEWKWLVLQGLVSDVALFGMAGR